MQVVGDLSNEIRHPDQSPAADRPAAAASDLQKRDLIEFTGYIEPIEQSRDAPSAAIELRRETQRALLPRVCV